MNLLTVKVVEQALEIMGQGMLGIFSVLVIIALFVGNRQKEKEEELISDLFKNQSLKELSTAFCRGQFFLYNR